MKDQYLIMDGRANLDIVVRAVVGGPWDDGGQVTRKLYSGGVWLPVFVPPAHQLTNARDIFAGRRAVVHAQLPTLRRGGRDPYPPLLGSRKRAWDPEGQSARRRR